MRYPEGKLKFLYRFRAISKMSDVFFYASSLSGVASFLMPQKQWQT